MNRWCWGPHLRPRQAQQKQNHILKTQTDNANDGYEISFAPCTVQWQHNRVTFALCTNPPLAAMISGCLVVVPILGSGMKLLVLFY